MAQLPAMRPDDDVYTSLLLSQQNLNAAKQKPLEYQLSPTPILMYARPSYVQGG